MLKCYKIIVFLHLTGYIKTQKEQVFGNFDLSRFTYTSTQKLTDIISNFASNSNKTIQNTNFDLNIEYHLINS